jgi:hypothetical protein
MLATIRSTLGRHLPTLAWHARRRRRAQALVEFAITVPVMVTLLLFSIYFYEIIQIKLKTQEVARYAAWEYTGFPLHDYDSGKTNGFGDAKNEITGDISKRYVNLKSGDRGQQNKWLMVEWSPPRVRMRDQKEPRIPGGGLANTIFTVASWVIDFWSMKAFTHGNPVLAVMMGIHKVDGKRIFGARGKRFNPPGKWGFNKKGYPKAEVSVRYRNLLLPRYFMEGTTGWYKGSGGPVKHYDVSDTTFEDHATVVADSWRLHHGDSVDGPKDLRGSEDTAYYKTVDRMAFVTPKIRKAVKLYLQIGNIILAVMSIASTQPPLSVDPVETTLVSKAYDSGPSSGKVTIPEDHGDVPYDTSPLGGDDEYEATLEKRGNNFMGCKDPEKLGCFDSVSQDNPFGPFVEPPPENP